MSIEATAKTVPLIPELYLHLEDDYPLESHLQIFESHMFLTTEWSMHSHSIIPKISFSVGLAEDKSIRGSYDSLKERRQALKKFNACLLRHKGHKPSNSDIGCFLGLFHAESDVFEDAMVFVDASLELRPNVFDDWARRLSGYIVEFSSRTRRAAAVTPHFYQNERFPHFHFLYEKRDGTDDENLLQHYLYDKINKVSKYKIR